MKTKITTWQLLNKSCRMTSQRKAKRFIIMASTLLLTIALSAGIIGHYGSKAEAEAAYEVPEVNYEQAPDPSIQEYVKSEVEKAGLNWNEVNCLIEHESGWNEWQQRVNNNHTTDSGLWQINSIHKGTIKLQDRFDIKASTAWSINKRLKEGNWSAWYGFDKCK